MRLIVVRMLCIGIVMGVSGVDRAVAGEECGAAPYLVGGAVFDCCDNPLTCGLPGVEICIECLGGFQACATSGEGAALLVFEDVPCDTCVITAPSCYCFVDNICPPEECLSVVEIEVNDANQADNQSLGFFFSGCSNDDECDDQDACTVDSCVAGCCVNAPECTVDEGCPDDGDPCTIAECIDDCCVHIPECKEDADCNDMDACTTDGCINGCCAHEEVGCDDGNPCTEDSCDPKTGCVHDAIGNCCTEDVHCDDEVFCNGQETCQEGQCVPGTPVDCTIKDAHCLIGVCNEGTDQCDVEPLPDGTECTDHDPCTENDICIEGNCMGQPIDCDDGDPCTTDHCDFDTGECVHEPVGECCADTDCDDGVDCTIDECVEGVCEHTPDHEFCDDEDKCTEDICDPTEGCMNLSVPDDDCCDDDEDCEDKEICVDNRCRRTCENDNDCDDDNDCTDDECIGSIPFLVEIPIGSV